MLNALVTQMQVIISMLQEALSLAVNSGTTLRVRPSC